MQFSEPVTLGQVLNEDAVYLLNQITADVVPVTVRFGDGNRTMTLIPRRPLPMGVDFFVKMPGLTDFAGNHVAGVQSFRTFKPYLVSPFRTPSGLIALNKSELFSELETRGFHVPSTLNSVSLKDIDFITRSPQESADGKWHTTLFGIGSSRMNGFQILSLDASQPTYVAPLGAMPGGERFYTRLQVFPAFGLRPRVPAPTVPADPNAAAIEKWSKRELHYLGNNPSERICADPGSPAIAAWHARQPASSAFAMRLGCGDLGIVTSQNVNYGVLHLYDLTDPAKPLLLGLRLLNDGGAISGFPRKPEAPEGNGAPRGIGVITGVDITHQANGGTAQHSDTNAAYIANQGVGIAMVDLDWNVPGIQDFIERKPAGQVVESLATYAFPYYNDTTVVNGHVIAVAADRVDGSGTAHLEVFDAGLTPIGAPLPLPVVPYA